MTVAGAPTTAPVESDGPVAGTERIVRVLDALVARADQGWGVRELAGVVGESRSTVNRILHALTQLRLAAPNGGGTYGVGPRLRVLAGMLHRTHPVLRHAPSVLADLSAASDATTMAVLQGWDPATAFVAALHQSDGAVRYQLHPGMTLPLHAGAAGKAVLMAVGTEVLKNNPLQRFTENTITAADALRNELAQARTEGFITSVGQHIPLAAGVAAPFKTPWEENAAVSITRPRYSTTDEDLARMGPSVKEASQRLATLRVTEAIVGGAREHLTRGNSAASRLERLASAIVAHSTGVPVDRHLHRWIGANPATVTRLVATATSLGVARASSDGALLLPGPRLVQWAATLGQRPPLEEIVHAEVAHLAAVTGETAVLAEYTHADRRAKIARVVPGRNPVHYGVATGTTIPLHAGATGKVILAHCPPDTMESLSLETLTPKTVSTPEALRRQLEAIRQQGWAEADGERVTDAFGLAAPFFEGNTVAGAVTLTIPRFRRDALDKQALVAEIMRVAARVTHLLTP